MIRLAQIACAAGLLLAAATAQAQPPAEAQRYPGQSYPGQPCVGNRNMCDALDALQQARASLQRSDSNKGGHRAQAIRSVDRAIQQVRDGIRYSNRR